VLGREQDSTGERLQYTTRIKTYQTYELKNILRVAELITKIRFTS
jgi:hypothetical protein